MAFGVMFMRDLYSHYAVNDDMTSPWNTSGADGNSSFAVDRTNGYAYINYISGNYYIRKYALSNGGVAASYDCTTAGIGEQNAFIVDGSGNVWSYNYGSQYLYKWDANLTGYTAYDIGSVVGGQIYNASMTADGSYIYVTGPSGGNRNLIAQLNTSDPSGGSNWEQDLGTTNCVYPTVGESGNVYVSGYGVDQRIRKLSVTDGSYLWPSPYYIDGGYYNAYCFETDRFYITRYGVSDDHRYYQIDPSDGSTIGYTEYLPFRSWCCAVYDQDTLYVGAASGGGSPEAIRKFSITNDWGSNEASTGTYASGSVRHYFAGDPTGYIHEQMGGGVETSEVDFDGKITIYVNSETSDFDGKIIITTTSYVYDLDGLILLYEYSENDLDGKILLYNISTNDFDGKVQVVNGLSSDFDGAVQIGKIINGHFTYAFHNDFDGKIFIYDLSVIDLDGRIVVTNNSLSDFDGKVLIYRSVGSESYPNWIYTGNYTGDGTNGRTISGIEFQPEALFIFNETTANAVWRCDVMPDGSCVDIDLGLVSNRILRFTSNGFEVDNNASTNQLGVNYYYIAFRENGDHRLATGSYVGDGTGSPYSDGQTVTDPSMGFTPHLIVVGGDSYDSVWKAYDAHSGTTSRHFKAAYTDQGDCIRSRVSNGFVTGGSDDTNKSGVTYYYICLNNMLGYAVFGYYQGDGTTDHDITGKGLITDNNIEFQPDEIWVARNSIGGTARPTIEKNKALDDIDLACPVNTTIAFANSIIDINSDGFKVGSSSYVNSATSTYVYCCFQDGGSREVISNIPEFNGRVYITQLSNDTQSLDGRVVITRPDQFACVFRYGGYPYVVYLLQRNMSTVVYSSTLPSGRYGFAVDRTNLFYYVSEVDTPDTLIRKRSLLNGQLLAEQTVADTDEQRVVVIDGNDYLWSCDNDGGGTVIYKWASNLASKTTYTLKVGGPVNGITDLAITFNNRYVYVVGSGSGIGYSSVAKYDIANLNGGDPEWSVIIGAWEAYRVRVDENDNVFVASETSQRIRKLSGIDGAYLWNIGGLNYIDGVQHPFAYCIENGMLYCPRNYSRYRQYRASDGALIATTVDSLGNAFTCAVYDENILYTGTSLGGTSGVREYEIDDDWVDGVETYTAIKTIGSSRHLFACDATGYLHEHMSPSDASTSDLDGKIYIFSVVSSASDFDGKVFIIGVVDSSEAFFDGRVDIYRGSEFDGKIILYSVNDNILNGKVDVVFNSVNTFDGEVDVVLSSINSFDGKISIIGTAQLFSFHVNNAFDDIEYPERTYIRSMGNFNNYIDTRTVAIIGLGHREEYLENEAMLDAADDLTVNMFDEEDRLYLEFGDVNGSGRYFRTSTYPIVSNSLQVYRTYKGSEELLNSDEYECSEQYGYIVVDHPLESYDTLRVSYIAESDINNPRLFTQFDELKTIYGSPSLNNTLSLAAKIAFDNGAERVLACQASENDTYFSNAYATLEKEECYWIVPVPRIGTTYTAVVVAGKTHVTKMSNTKHRRERVLICGEVNNDSERLYRTDAVNIDSKRVIMLAPTTVVRTVINGESIVIDGRLIAASAAGRLSGLEKISYPLTNKMLEGFTIDKRYAVNFNRNRDTQTGVSFLSLLSTGAEVWHGVNTIQNGVPEDQEISIVRIGDFVISNLRRNLDNLYIGSVYNQNVILSITGSVRSYLDSVMSREIIRSYQNVIVKPDSSEPRQMNITFDIEPIYPLNMISISFGYALI